MVFSLACSRDLPALMALYRAASLRMEEQGIFQWDEAYPDLRVLSKDVSRNELQIGLIGGRIAVAFSIEYCKKDDYEPAAWRYGESRFAVLHRLCVHPAYQGRGIAREAMDHIEQSVLARGIYAIRLDAFSLNPAALQLYASRGYEKAGEIRYRKGLFYLYEKNLHP